MSENDVHDPSGVRLQKLLASAGVASRRASENLILEGRVEVDGQTVTELGTRVNPEASVIRVDGERLNLNRDLQYFAFNKPLGVVSTMKDEQGRMSIAEFIGNRRGLFHVGRLDANTEGLLLLTSDGPLAHRLQHPSFGVLKTYVALVPGPIPRGLGKRMKEGIELEDGPVSIDSFRLLDATAHQALVEISLHEGRKHVVRRLLEEVGHPVVELARTKFGPVALGDLKVGKLRPLSRAEISALYDEAGL